MTPGIFNQACDDMIAKDTLREILVGSQNISHIQPHSHHDTIPQSLRPTPLEIQHDMSITKRFLIEHGPNDCIAPKVLKIVKLKETIAPASETY